VGLVQFPSHAVVVNHGHTSTARQGKGFGTWVHVHLDHLFGVRTRQRESKCTGSAALSDLEYRQMHTAAVCLFSSASGGTTMPFCYYCYLHNAPDMPVRTPTPQLDQTFKGELPASAAVAVPASVALLHCWQPATGQ
jgi:hypothetical protein